MGMISDIQRFSLNDGPGIRTTVFFKGCNMSCDWCHNPETLKVEPELMVYGGRCVGCGACVGFEAARMAKGLPPGRGELLLESADVCFAGALTVAGMEMSAAQVMEQVVKDATYYKTSGGGVTLSGGEALMQAQFAGEILTLLRSEGIQAAIETNLAYEWERLEKLLPDIDLVMADVKMMDSEKHRRHTGIGNEQILKNVRKLAKAGVAYILRTPVIPGVNDNAEDIAAIARFVSENREGLMYYELLNYNPLGASKYEGLGAKNAHGAARPLANEAMEGLRRAAEGAGIAVRVG